MSDAAPRSGPPAAPDAGFPRIAPVGLSGLLVSFGDRLDEGANRAALAFRAELDAQGWDGVEETATSLVSAFVRFDPLALSPDALHGRLADLLATRDWTAAPLPGGRRHLSIPCAYGGAEGPQLDEAAEAAGLSPDRAIEELSQARVRVMTIGFAPGQPYLGQLAPHWDIPRLTGLTPRVPRGALVAAVRQLIVFANDTPTGWRQVGLTAFRCFRPDDADPFALAPGDEISFPAVPAADIARLREGADPAGGTTVTVLE